MSGRTGDLGNLLVGIGVDSQDLVRGLQAAETRTRNFSTKAQNQMQSFSNAWVEAAAKIYLVQNALRSAAAAFNAFMGPAIRFESAFAGVRKTVDATEAEFRQLEQSLLDMSKRIPVTAESLAGIQEIAGQLGVRGVENLTKFTETVAKIEASTNLSGQAAATAFARISNVMQEPLTNVDRMGAAVVDLGNNFATTESEIVTFAQRISGAGRIANLTTADVLAISTAMSSVGIEAEAGGTAVQKVLIELHRQGRSGREEFVKFVDQIRRAGDDGIKVLERMGLEDQRLIRSFLSLANAGDLLERTIATSNKAWAENNALNVEAAKRFATTEAKMKLAQNAMVAMSRELGVTLLPQVNAVLDAFTQLVNKMTELEQKQGLVTRLGMPGLGMGLGGQIGSMIGQNMGQPGAMGGVAGAAGGMAANGLQPGSMPFSSPIPGGGAAPAASTTTTGGGAMTATTNAQPAGLGGGGGMVSGMIAGLEELFKKLDEADEKTKNFGITFQNMSEETAEIFTTGVGQMFDVFGASFAGMLVQGQSFSEAMKAGFKQLAAQFIASLVSMIAQWLAFIAAVMVIALILQAFGVPIGETFKAAFKMMQGTSADTALGPLSKMKGGGGFSWKKLVMPGFRDGGAFLEKPSLSARNGLGVVTGTMGEGGIPATVHPNEAIIPLDKLFSLVRSGSGETHIHINGYQQDPRTLAEIVAFEVNRQRRAP